MESVKNYIPHSGFMKLIDNYISIDFDQNKATIGLTLDINKPYWDKNSLFKTYWSIEMMAQAVAAFHQKQTNANDKPQMGYLISIDSYELFESMKLKPGDKINIIATMEMDLFPIGVYSCKVMSGDTLISEASMKFLIEEGELLSKEH
ncbi:MAG: hypothetical protein GY714_19145 [Desulfobacterales bacterium]|nr:hypothetical protein [Desulfobacterales bacterium]